MFFPAVVMNFPVLNLVEKKNGPLVVSWSHPVRLFLLEQETEKDSFRLVPNSSGHSKTGS